MNNQEAYGKRGLLVRGTCDGGPERGPANIHAAIRGGLEDTVKLMKYVVKEEQGHPLLDIGHKGPVL